MPRERDPVGLDRLIAALERQRAKARALEPDSPPVHDHALPAFERAAGGRLGARSVEILRLIAEGHSHDQIVGSNDQITYYDIMIAAQEALDLDDVPARYVAANVNEREPHHAWIETIRETYPHAYEPWTPDEEDRPRRLHDGGAGVPDISRQLGRQPGGIRSRLMKLGIID